MTVTPLSLEQESVLESNLVWIFASRRSGTTWLGYELLSHGTLYMDEPLLGLHLGRFDVTPNGLARTVDLQKSREDYFFSEKYQEVCDLYLKKLILNRIYSQFHNLSRQIIVKEPNGSYASDILTRCMPLSRIIVLLRDGRDTLDSSMDALQKGGWETQRGHSALTSEKRIEFIQRHSKNWTKLMEIIMNTYNFHSEDRRLLIRYEDLLQNTVNITKKIYEFLKIDIESTTLETIVEKYSFQNIPESLRGKGKFRRSATPGMWKENFTEEEKNIMEQIMGAMLRKLGY